MDLPGIEKKNLNIEVLDGALLISGERKEKQETKKDHYYKMETSYGKFERRFNLPKDIDVKAIQANSKEGVLEVVLPKLQNQKQEKCKIEIK